MISVRNGADARVLDADLSQGMAAIVPNPAMRPIDIAAKHGRIFMWLPTLSGSSALSFCSHLQEGTRRMIRN